MSFLSHYQPAVKENWQGRTDGPNASRYHEVIDFLDLTKRLTNDTSDKHIALLGFCCDEGIRRNQGRIGAASGPEAFRQALAKLPAPHCKISDAGNILCIGSDLEAAQQALGDAVASLLANGYFPLLIGGGHEIAWGHYLGIEKIYPQQNIAVVNIDAHFDLRPLVNGSQGSSGTSFLQIAQRRLAQGLTFNYTCFGIQALSNTEAMFAQAEKLDTVVVTAEEFHLGKMDAILAVADEVISCADVIYLTVCLDVFAAPFAPGVSATQPLGLFPWHVIPLLQHFKKSGKVVAMDIAELSPPHDRDGITAHLAAAMAGCVIT